MTVQIDRPSADVFEFASAPENLPKWVKSFCLSVKQSGDDWRMETPTGVVEVQFVPANELGVLDHVVTLPDGIPMRVVANGDGSEVTFTLFRLPEMPHEQFEKDAGMVDPDLRILKDVMEATR